MDAMISLQVSSSEAIAKDLNTYLRRKGHTTWICIEMDGGETYRESIVLNATESRTMIALMNIRWAESKECRYEFNIATRSHLTKGHPQIIPIILENFDWSKYPLITGVMANTNGIFYNPSNPSETWDKVATALASYVQSASPDLHVSQTVTSMVITEPLPEKIPEWKMVHVSQWLQTLDFPAPREAFMNNWVDGPMLLDLTMHDLLDSMKLTGLQARRMMREINDLKNNLKTVPPPTTPFEQSKISKLSGAMAKIGGSFTSQLVSAVPSRLNVLRSKSGFTTGIWEGYYEYNNGKREEMKMDITMIGGIIAGYGTDPNGDFIAQGSYDDRQLTCNFDKAYLGKHTVYYTGKLEGGNTLKGKWEIPGQTDGKFQFTYKKPK